MRMSVDDASCYYFIGYLNKFQLTKVPLPQLVSLNLFKEIVIEINKLNIMKHKCYLILHFSSQGG